MIKMKSEWVIKASHHRKLMDEGTKMYCMWVVSVQSSFRYATESTKKTKISKIGYICEIFTCTPPMVTRILPKIVVWKPVKIEATLIHDRNLSVTMGISKNVKGNVTAGYWSWLVAVESFECFLLESIMHDTKRSNENLYL